MIYAKRCLIFCTIVFSIPCFSSQEGQGGLPGAFLRTGVGARALGMGRAFTALADDATSAYWNPAGLALLERTEIHSTMSALSMDRTSSFISCALSLTNRSSLAFSWSRYGDTNIIGRDIDGVFTRNYEKSQNTFVISYGRSMSDRLFIGANLKYFSNHLFDYDGSGTGFDLGALIIPTPRIRMGIVVQDISGNLAWDTNLETIEKIPLVTRVGLTTMPFSPVFKICFDYEKINGMNALFHYGLEMDLLKSLQIRAGYDQTLTFGGSLLIPVENLDLRIDYSLREDPIDKSKRHQFSFSTKLGQPKYNSYSNLNNDLNDLLKEISSPLARVIKIASSNPEYVLINAGENEGVYNNQIVNIYRNINDDNINESILLGEARVIKCKDSISAIKILNLQEGYQIEIGDFIHIQ